MVHKLFCFMKGFCESKFLRIIFEFFTISTTKKQSYLYTFSDRKRKPIDFKPLLFTMVKYVISKRSNKSNSIIDDRLFSKGCSKKRSSTHMFQTNRFVLILRFAKIIFLPGCSQIRLVFLKHYGIIKWVNTGFCGFKSQKSWKCQVLMSVIMKSGFHRTNLKQINSRKLLNLLFKYISPINGPTKCNPYSNMFSYDVLWFSYDCLMTFLWFKVK